MISLIKSDGKRQHQCRNRYRNYNTRKYKSAGNRVNIRIGLQLAPDNDRRNMPLYIAFQRKKQIHSRIHDIKSDNFLNQILIHSTGSVIAAFIFAGYLFIPKINLFFQTKKLSFFVILSIILCIFLIVCAYLYFHSDLAYRILDPLTLVKESLYIRFIIWNGIIALIIKSPIFGYGLGDKAEFFIRPRVFLSYNAHNAYLQTLYEGGIITIATVLFALFIASEKLKKNNNRHLIGIFHIIIFSDLIMMLSAIPAWYTWYPILLIAQIAVCTAEIQEI